MTTPTQANDAGGAAALYARKYHEARAEIERLTAELDRRNGNPSTRLHNLCEAIAQERDGSEFSREEWERIDADNARLLAANAALTEALRELVGTASGSVELDDWPELQASLANARAALEG